LLYREKSEKAKVCIGEKEAAAAAARLRQEEKEEVQADRWSMEECALERIQEPP